MKTINEVRRFIDSEDYFVALDEMYFDLVVEELPARDFFWVSYQHGNA